MPLATWNGPFDALLPDMSILRVGEQREISDEQAESGHWTVPGQTTPPPAPTAPPAFTAANTPSTATATTAEGAD